MMDNDEALRALNIKPGVLYTVVPVCCMEKDCLYHLFCQDNAVGLTEKEDGRYMICQDFKERLYAAGKRKKVFWKRKES